jgi:DNA-binding transcriptional LysR family regulator
MKLDIDGIQAFVLIAEQGGFQKAAERLHLTPTALTRRLQRLEAYLGLRLLDRTTRSVALTAVGREFLPQAERLVGELTRSVDRLKDMSQGATGDVTIACVTSMAYRRLPAVIRLYAEKYPGNRVRILDRSSMLVTEAVRQGQAEFGLNILLLRDADLIEKPLLQDPFMLVCLRSHPMAKLEQATWSDLRGADLITFTTASVNRLLIDYQLSRKRLDVRVRFEVEHITAALGLVSAGVGVAIRTFLSWSLELESRWPWQRPVESPVTPAHAA